MSATFADSPEFQRLLQGVATVDLARLALEIARDAEPMLDPNPYLAQIEALAERTRPRCSPQSTPLQIARQINWTLFVEENYRGNDEDYFDPRNSYLNEVIDRRLGIPITLSVLYLAVAERLGFAMAGVNLPAHFLLRAGQGVGTFFVDPFHEGAILDRAGCARVISARTGQAVVLAEHQFVPCSTATIVARMLRNLKAIHLRASDTLSALPVLRRLTALDTRDPTHQRDLGLICLQLERPGEAVEHLQAYLDRTDMPADGALIRDQLRAARRALALRN